MKKDKSLWMTYKARVNVKKRKKINNRDKMIKIIYCPVKGHVTLLNRHEMDGVGGRHQYCNTMHQSGTNL